MSFLQNPVEYLGQIISAQRIEPDPAIEANFNGQSPLLLNIYVVFWVLPASIGVLLRIMLFSHLI